MQKIVGGREVSFAEVFVRSLIVAATLSLPDNWQLLLLRQPQRTDASRQGEPRGMFRMLDLPVPVRSKIHS